MAYRPHVAQNPETFSFNREASDSLLILASDGLMSCLSEDEIAFQAEGMLQQGYSLSEITEHLVDSAILFGSRDNVSLVLVDLRRSSAEEEHFDISEPYTPEVSSEPLSSPLAAFAP